VSGPAFAQSATSQQLQQLQQQIEAQQQQINQQQQQLELLKAQARQAQTAADQAGVAAQKAQTQAQAAQAAAPAPAPAGKTAHNLLYSSKSVNLTIGGFIEDASIDRNHNEVADVGSSFKIASGSNGIPLPISEQYYGSEFRNTARQSRLSLLAQGDDNLKSFAAYYEMDFLGAGSSSNSGESNSYLPRIRHIYATYDDNEDGWHILGGQTWSLLTMDRVGITPRTEVTPTTIDAQYVTGFTWTRAPQVRVVKDFDKTVWVGISAETPQASIYNNSCYANACGGAGVGTVTTGVAGSGQLSTTPTYSLDEFPDVIAKVAVDPGFGHYEVYGIARNFYDRANLASVSPGSHNTWGGGGGASALVPVIPKMLDLQGSFLVGNGIGRYGSSQFNDVAVNSSNDQLTPIPEFMALVGAVGHPTNDLDLYAYGGYEGVSATAVNGKTSGYGNPNYVNTGCTIEGSALGCAANNKDVYQGTIGGWYKFYQGNAGLMEVGASEAYVHVDTFAGVGGAPKADENIVMVSFRYYPF
jgi:hypothetical protein